MDPEFDFRARLRSGPDWSRKRQNREFLIENHRSLMQRPYEPAACHQRIRTFRKAHRRRGPREMLTWRDTGALFKSHWLVEVVQRGRRTYGRLLDDTLVRRPHQIGIAVALATMRHYGRTAAARLVRC